MMAATKKEQAQDAAATYDEVFDLLAQARDGEAAEAIRRSPRLRAHQGIIVTTILAVTGAERQAARAARVVEPEILEPTDA